MKQFMTKYLKAVSKYLQSVNDSLCYDLMIYIMAYFDLMQLPVNLCCIFSKYIDNATHAVVGKHTIHVSICAQYLELNTMLELWVVTNVNQGSIFQSCKFSYHAS